MKRLKFFECCHFVKGASRAIICDLQRSSYVFVPLSLAEMIASYDAYTVEEIKDQFPLEDHQFIDEYIAFLVKEEFVFFTSSPGSFPKISLDWDEPYQITNAIIDIDEINYPWDKIIPDFEELGCRHVQIRCFSPKEIAYFNQILGFFENSRVASIELIIEWHEEWNDQILLEFYESFPRVLSLIVHSVNRDCRLESTRKKFGAILLTSQKISSSKHCGIISLEYLSLDIKTFTEAKNHNSCLNRKISIDSKGNIKNCPSMPESFGNINDSSLQKALNHPEFKKYWNVSKDQVTVCKDCEFRYICTDCRAYLENPEDIYSKPLKCGYNPYTCEWEEWSTNPLKQKAIGYYGMRSIIDTETSK